MGRIRAKGHELYSACKHSIAKALSLNPEPQTHRDHLNPQKALDRAVQHRPFDVASKEHQTFVARQLHEIEALQAAYPHVNKILVCCCVISECRVSHMCKLVVCELAGRVCMSAMGSQVCVLVRRCLCFGLVVFVCSREAGPPRT